MVRAVGSFRCRCCPPWHGGRDLAESPRLQHWVGYLLGASSGSVVGGTDIGNAVAMFVPLSTVLGLRCCSLMVAFV